VPQQNYTLQQHHSRGGPWPRRIGTYGSAPLLVIHSCSTSQGRHFITKRGILRFPRIRFALRGYNPVQNCR
jgi:hypothetical protein